MNPTPPPPHASASPSSESRTSAAASGPRGNGSAADDLPKFRYTAEFANQVEVRWQETWEAQNTFSTPNPGQPGFDAGKPKFYCLDMFPYPSGAGLHVGHPEGYTATDIICRFMRMKGRNVLHPMGWDAYGLPAEQYAIQTGVHPAITTKTAIDNFRRQLKRFGFSYDWKREFGTIDPEYYKWTQWIFLKAYDSWFDPEAANGTGGKGRARPIADLVRQLESGDLRVTAGGDLVHVGVAANNPILGGEPAGTLRWHELKPEQRRQVIDDQRLAYLAESTVNWCPALGTVLANDEVIDGRSERGGHPVLRKPLKQWMFRITAYAQRLLEDLALVDWPESTKTMQSEWIGRSEGAEIDFILEHTQDEFLRVFTTRPDTLFGATYMVVAPEHPLVKRAMNQPQPGADAAAIAAYVKQTQGKAEVDRMTDAGGKEKTGVFTGFFCVNPATGEKIPVWTADYVLMSYGHGAIMAVPAHDERDFEFAQKFGLPIVDVVYTHIEAAMRHFAQHATLEEQAPERWKHVLADMLGVVTSTNADMEHLHKALMTVRTRRAVPPVHPAPEAAKRGAISGEWLETIEDLKFTGFAGFKAVFEQKRFRAHAGSAGSAPGLAVNSHNKEVSLDGMATDEAKKRICAWLSKTGRGNARVNFRLRDWAFSRQRYWGEPFPIVYDQKGNHYPVGEKALPVELPALADYSPVESEDPQPLLAKATQWMNTTAGAAGVDPNVLPPETPVRRETNTMPGSAGSSWYFLRYADARNSERFVGREAEAYWMGTGAKGAEKARAGVDLYIGGSEHAVGHLLYARFWQKILFDLGEVSVPEPFGKLFHQGLITSFAFQRADKTIIAVDEVKEVSEGKFVESANGNPVTPVVTKMSKRYKNVVNPDDVIAELGADTFRIYEMYMGPLAASKPWNTKDAVGIFRFLQRAWRLAVDEQTGELKLLDAPKPGVDKHLHRMIAKVDQDIPRLAFNTGIAAMIEFVNEATSAGGITREQLRLFTLALAPFAPHIAEELWAKLGHTKSLAYEPFPVPDPALLVDDVIEIPVQIAGKVRGRIMVPAASAGDKAAIERMALEDPAIKVLLEGKKVQKVIVVPGKMVNVVAV